ncbi:hypothetical protein [Deinococcus sp.]
MTRLKGNGSGPVVPIIVVIIVLIVLFLLAYFLYLKPQGLLNLHFI